jgi:hypothetical protein
MRYVVQHPDPVWILGVLRELMTGALTRPRIDFRSALPLTVQALQARHGDAAALQALADDRQRTLAQVDNLSPERGEGDPWAHYLRRLAALAEVYALVLDQPVEAQKLLDKALNLHFQYNFAGFRALARLTLAESLCLCGRADPATLAQTLDSALAAAHNIQDAQFCAQMTARVNAMQARWWPAPPAPLDIVPIIERFTQHPSEAAFAPLHRVSDPYQHRPTNLPTRLSLPESMRTACTLREIVPLYPGMQMAAARALNPQLPPEPLPDGTLVHINDPDFAPLLAARLSAAAVVATRLAPGQRAALRGAIQSLVPLAAANRTALDTVAARLLMVALPQDVTRLESLVQTTDEHAFLVDIG